MPVTNYYTVNGQIIGEKTTGGSRIDYMRDALGNVTGTLDQNAQVINRYRYKPYGGLLSKTGTGPDPKFRWVGSWGYRQTSKRFSDVYVRARHYDTKTARWTTKDKFWPILLPYRYSASSPSVYADWSGHIIRVENCFCEKCEYVSYSSSKRKSVRADYSILPDIQRTCDELHYCMEDPTCKKKLEDCVRKFNRNAPSWLRCMDAMCQSKLITAKVHCGGSWFGGCRGGTCAYTKPGKPCNIYICTNQKRELCGWICPYPWHIGFDYPDIARCDVPACKDEFQLKIGITFLHELAHCCGMPGGWVADPGTELEECLINYVLH